MTFASPFHANSTVSLDAPGWSLERICASISQQIGHQVVPSRVCANDYLIVHVHNVPWPELQKRLAWVEYGKWITNGQALTIQRDPKLVKARIEKNTDDTAKYLQNWLRSHEKVLALPPFNAKSIVRQFIDLTKKAEASGSQSTSDKYPAAYSVASQVPFSRAMSNLLMAFSAHQVASIPLGKRVVYSNHPTALQSPLPSSVKQALDQLIDQQTQFLKELAAAGKSAEGFDRFGGRTPLSKDDTYNLVFASEVYLRRFTFRVFSQEGNVIYENWEFLPDNGITAFSSLPEVPPKSIALSPELKAVVNDLRLASNSDLSASPSLLAKLHRPEEHDILTLVVNPILKLSAADKNIVVRNDLLPANFVSRYGPFDNGTIPEGFLSNGSLRFFTDLDVDPQWLTLRPNYQYPSRADGISRSDYSNLIGGVNENGLVDPKSILEFAAATGPNGFLQAVEIAPFLNAITFNANPLFPIGDGWTLLRLAGLLDQASLAKAESGSGLDLATLPSKAQEAYQTFLFSRFLEPGPRVGGGKPSIECRLQNEPTYAFTHSLPHGILKISRSSGSFVAMDIHSPSNKTFQMLYELPDFARATEQQHDSLGTFDLSRLKVFPYERLFITISFPGQELPGASATVQAQAYSSTVYSSWQNFPPDVRDGIQAALGKAKVSR